MPVPPLCRLLHDDQKESGLLPILARLIKQFDHRVQSRDHAHDLVQCLHVVLRMLERLGREGEDERFASVAESLMLLLKLACPCLCLYCFVCCNWRQLDKLLTAQPSKIGRFEVQRLEGSWCKGGFTGQAAEKPRRPLQQAVQGLKQGARQSLGMVMQAALGSRQGHQHQVKFLCMGSVSPERLLSLTRQHNQRRCLQAVKHLPQQMPVHVRGHC